MMDQDYECRLLRQINIQNENASPLKAVGAVRSLTPTSSPLSSPSKHGDRFIPSRAGANWSVNFHRINEIEKSHNQNRKTKDGTTDSNKGTLWLNCFFFFLSGLFLGMTYHTRLW
ncbi:Fizzy- protein [Xenoophorus captivus]|uniref:Fizzy- protein n=1 Tax=Xenoophorus captivus TaxID=1517983 RepID=A0ABV0R2P0_9TELE